MKKTCATLSFHLVSSEQYSYAADGAEVTMEAAEQGDSGLGIAGPNSPEGAAAMATDGGSRVADPLAAERGAPRLLCWRERRERVTSGDHHRRPVR